MRDNGSDSGWTRYKNAANRSLKASIDVSILVTKVTGPALITPCCGASTFKATAFNRNPTAEERKTIQWMVKDESGAELKPNEGADWPMGEELKIDGIPDWWGPNLGKTIKIYAYFKSPSEKVSVEALVEASGVARYIALVQKVEEAYSSRSGEDVLNRLRRLAGYDDSKFQKMYMIRASPGLEPKGILTQGDIDELKAMSLHDAPRTSDADEVGIAQDCHQRDVALGHVLCGMTAGRHRIKDHNISGQMSIWGTVTAAGEDVDNLFATTIAGDIGQAAVLVYQQQDTKYIGWPDSDASHAELRGDMDGVLLGLKAGLLDKTSLSRVLCAYYCGKKVEGQDLGYSAARRHSGFNKAVTSKTLLDQSFRFAVNYNYTFGKWQGAWADDDDLKAHVTAAHNEFATWSAEEQAAESPQKK